MPLPPDMLPGDKVVLFDGVCRLCTGWSRFLLRHDRDRRLKLCSVQSPEGQAILDWFGLPTDYFDTLLYIDGHCGYERSEAFLRVIGQLPAPWNWLRVLWLVPMSLRDGLYDRIARNRYRLFGREDRCLMPSAEYRGRFLGNG
ncbi:thiol-disulfide oxidoreductase DCC family protein [Pseudomonas sp. MT3]|uniref:thiol-disulfide oxidoreductase DCC family protein n=1 Tax=Pseudomonas sp. ATCC 13867 TaxID=1294143 RepID=UPI0002C4E17B|nr:thiol-disulfide oxidoreductase DCC family protein [Pseudomonas sp. ATCC 13867]AGI23264.1 thiol-disulfide oxidoreductase [Pseudomonas sp. ATCC 13867]RFQ19972.1 thiol-disulfide oxidoreductase DCC family protein [Pseudomonas sp. ATCC 13867]